MFRLHPQRSAVVINCAGHVALNNEMDKANPDQNKIFALQKEVSSLRSDFDQKALAHQLEVRKLLPDNYQGSGYGKGRGYCW